MRSNRVGPGAPRGLGQRPRAPAASAARPGSPGGRRASVGEEEEEEEGWEEGRQGRGRVFVWGRGPEVGLELGLGPGATLKQAPAFPA